MARESSRRNRIALIVTLLVLAGCARMQPAPPAPETAAPPSDAAFWAELGGIAGADWHVLLNRGPQALDWRLTAIDSARDSIDLQTFLWMFDTAGAMVLDHLVAAADRGVRIRMLIDDTFLAGEDPMLLALARHPNIEYRVFNPFGRRGGGLVTRQLLNLAELDRLDHRMHNKAMIVDQRVAIVGGRNLADEYFGLNENANFRDLETLLGGPTVGAISDAFDRYWNDRWAVPIETLSHASASSEQLAHAREVSGNNLHLHEEIPEDALLERWRKAIAGAHAGDTVLYVDEPPGEDPAAEESAPIAVAGELVRLFDSARDEIVIVSAYLIPTPNLEGAIERAIERGVTVRILTNSLRSNNHLAAHSASRRHIRSLLGLGAQLHEVRIDASNRRLYMQAPVERKALALHAKALVIDDDRVFIGSANLDPRSLRINTEMGLLVNSRSLNGAVRKALQADFAADNAWRLVLGDDERLYWESGEQRLERQPAMSNGQLLEDWFLSLLPIEAEL